MSDCNLVSKFDYDLELKADGKVIVRDNCGDIIEPVKDNCHPDIKEIVNIRTLTIIEAKGSEWIYVDGEWLPV